jgi:hypothetical protein
MSMTAGDSCTEAELTDTATAGGVNTSTSSRNAATAVAGAISAGLRGLLCMLLAFGATLSVG